MADISDKEIAEEADNAGLPSLFTSWSQVYVLVMVELFVLIGLFYFFTKAFG